MARMPFELIAANASLTTVKEAEKLFVCMRSALTRANRELRNAEIAFGKEAAKVRGVPEEKYPQSYTDAEDRLGHFVLKLAEADEAYQDAREKLAAARVNAAAAAAVVAERRTTFAEVTYATA